MKPGGAPAASGSGPRSRGTSRRSACPRNSRAATSRSTPDRPVQPRQPRGSIPSPRPARQVPHRSLSALDDTAAAGPCRSAGAHTTDGRHARHATPRPGPARTARTSARNASCCRPCRPRTGQARGLRPRGRWCTTRRGIKAADHIRPMTRQSGPGHIDPDQCSVKLAFVLVFSIQNYLVSARTRSEQADLCGLCSCCVR